MHNSAMSRPQPVIPVEVIASRIYLIRGEKVMLDSDLAELYDVPTSALNQPVYTAGASGRSAVSIETLFIRLLHPLPEIRLVIPLTDNGA